MLILSLIQKILRRSVKLRLLQATLITWPSELGRPEVLSSDCYELWSEEPGWFQTQRELLWMPTLTLINSETKAIP